MTDGLPGGGAALLALLDRAASSPPPLELELGEEPARRWWSCRALPTELGTRPGTLLVVAEITERKRADLRIADTEQLWRSLTQNTDDTMIVVGRDLRIRSINRTLPPATSAQVIGRRTSSG